MVTAYDQWAQMAQPQYRTQGYQASGYSLDPERSAYEADLYNRQQGARGMGSSVVGSLGNLIFGGKTTDTVTPVWVDETVANQEAAQAQAYRQAQAQAQAQLMAQAVSDQSVAQQQGQASLASALADQARAQQSGLGSQRGLVALQGARVGQGALARAGESTLGGRLQELQQSQQGLSSLASGDEQAREASFRAAKANQDMILQQEQRAAEIDARNRKVEQENVGKLATLASGGAYGVAKKLW